MTTGSYRADTAAMPGPVARWRVSVHPLTRGKPPVYGSKKRSEITCVTELPSTSAEPPAGLVAQSPDNPSAVPSDLPTSEDPFYICGDGMRHATAQETASDQGVAPASSLSARPSHLACRVRRLSRSPAHAGSLPASRVRHRMSPSLSSDRMQCLLRVDGLKVPIGTRILVKTGGDGQLGGFRPGHPKHGT